MNNNEEFLKVYNDLYDQICDLRNKTTNYKGDFREDFAVCINNLRNQNIIIGKNYDFLDGIRKIRNIKIHDNFVNENLLINDEIINKCILLTQKLQNPPEIREYADKRQRQIYQIDIANTDKYIYEVINDMIVSGYSYVPILQNGAIIGLFDNSVIVSRLNQSKSFDQTSKISDIDKSLFAANDKHIYEIISNTQEIEDCIKIFDDYYVKNQKLSAIIITETGKNTDRILEIITAYDINWIEENFL